MRAPCLPAGRSQIFKHFLSEEVLEKLREQPIPLRACLVCQRERDISDILYNQSWKIYTLHIEMFYFNQLAFNLVSIHEVYYCIPTAIPPVARIWRGNGQKAYHLLARECDDEPVLHCIGLSSIRPGILLPSPNRWHDHDQLFKKTRQQIRCSRGPPLERGQFLSLWTLLLKCFPRF